MPTKTDQLPNMSQYCVNYFRHIIYNMNTVIILLF